MSSILRKHYTHITHVSLISYNLEQYATDLSKEKINVLFFQMNVYQIRKRKSHIKLYPYPKHHN